MGEMADDFRFMKEQRLKERQAIEPSRFEYAIDRLKSAGYRVEKDPEDFKSLIVNRYIRLWPFTGWWSGKGIGSGRGIHKLIEKLENQ